MDKSELINRIIKETGATSYLEIGYGDGYNFNQIDCDTKIGVDPNVKPNSGPIYPDTSDEFFKENDYDYDVIFIDGDHTAKQVRKDIINSFKCNPKAVILHDTLPRTKAMQEVPRKTKIWTGDVWRAVVGFISKNCLNKGVIFKTHRSDFGLTVIYNSPNIDFDFEITTMPWEYFQENSVQLLNVVD